MKTQHCLVLVTCPTTRQALRLAKVLVRRRLAACVNVVPAIRSLFWWQGKVDQARETLLLIKTTARRFEALRAAVCSLHPYDVPEVIALPITRGHRPYLQWIEDSLRPVRRS